MLGVKNSSQIDEFFTRGRHEDLDNSYISQSCFALPRQIIRNNSDRLILFKQILRDVQKMYYDIGAYDMKYDEFKQLRHKAWSERFNYLTIRNNSDRLILFKQILRDVQSMYNDIGAFDMNYDEFKEMYRVAWGEKINYLCIEKTKNKNEGKYPNFNESETKYFDCIPETEPF